MHIPSNYLDVTKDELITALASAVYDLNVARTAPTTDVAWLERRTRDEVRARIASARYTIKCGGLTLKL